MPGAGSLTQKRDLRSERKRAYSSPFQFVKVSDHAGEMVCWYHAQTRPLHGSKSREAASEEAFNAYKPGGASWRVPTNSTASGKSEKRGCGASERNNVLRSHS